MSTIGFTVGGLGPRKIIQASALALDINDDSTPARQIINVRDMARIAFQLVQATGAWTTAVVEVMCSIDGGNNWVSLPQGTLEYTSVGVKDPILVIDFSHVALEVTTAEGSAATLDLSVGASTFVI